MNLLKKIWYLQPSVDTFNKDKYQYVSGSHWNQHKRKLQQIKEENKVIGQKVMHQQFEQSDYKKKLKEDIKDYIQLRNSIRKCKPSKEHKTSKTDRPPHKLEQIHKPNQEEKEGKV